MVSVRGGAGTRPRPPPAAAAGRANRQRCPATLPVSSTRLGCPTGGGSPVLGRALCLGRAQPVARRPNGGRDARGRRRQCGDRPSRSRTSARGADGDDGGRQAGADHGIDLRAIVHRALAPAHADPSVAPDRRRLPRPDGDRSRRARQWRVQRAPERPAATAQGRRALCQPPRSPVPTSLQAGGKAWLRRRRVRPGRRGVVIRSRGHVAAGQVHRRGATGRDPGLRQRCQDQEPGGIRSPCRCRLDQRRCRPRQDASDQGRPAAPRTDLFPDLRVPHHQVAAAPAGYSRSVTDRRRL